MGNLMLGNFYLETKTRESHIATMPEHMINTDNVHTVCTGACLLS